VPNYDKWYQKKVESQTKAFLYFIGQNANEDSPDNRWIGGCLHLLVREIQFHNICQIWVGGNDCYDLHGFETGNEELTWIEFNEKLRVELCDVLLSHTRTLIKSALTEVEFPEEGVLELLKEKLPIFFAE
jgi:hypothetical protein